MFERFTGRARRVLVLAQHEARLLKHAYIGTEHLLLGLIAEREGVAAEALESLDVTYEAAREEIEHLRAPGTDDPPGHQSPPFTQRCKRVLDLSLKESSRLRSESIGTEHILLGLVREGEGTGVRVLQNLGVERPSVRQRVMELISGYQATERPLAASSQSLGLPGMLFAAHAEEMGIDSQTSPLAKFSEANADWNLSIGELNDVAVESRDSFPFRVIHADRASDVGPNLVWYPRLWYVMTGDQFMFVSSDFDSVRSFLWGLQMNDPIRRRNLGSDSSDG